MSTFGSANHGAAPRRRRIDPEEKKARVVRTARRLFVQKGYHNVSIPMIVEAAEVSTGAIYSYFSTKEELARYIHETTLADFYRQFRERLEGKGTTYERLRTFAELVFDLAEEEPDLMEYLLFMKHGEFMQDAAPICFSEPFQLIRQIVAEGIRRGDLRRGDHFISAVSFTGAILRPVELRFRCVLEKPLHDIAEELITNAWAAIRA